MKNFAFLFLFACIFATFQAKAAVLPTFKTAYFTVSDSLNLKDMVGTYNFKDKGLPFEKIEVTFKEDGKIHVEAGDRIVDLSPKKDDANAFETPEATLHFVRNADKKVVALKLEVDGDMIEGARVEK